MIDPLMLMPMLMNMNGGGGNNMENILKMVSGMNGSTPPQPTQNAATQSPNMDMTSLLSALGGNGGDKSNPMLNILPTMMSMMNNNQQNTNIPPQNNGNSPPQGYNNSPPQGYNNSPPQGYNNSPPQGYNTTQNNQPQNMANIKPLPKKARNTNNEYHGYYQDLDAPPQPSGDNNNGYNNIANNAPNNPTPYNQATALDTSAAAPPNMPQNSPNSPNIAPNARPTQGSGFAPIGDLGKNDINYALFNLMKNRG